MNRDKEGFRAAVNTLRSVTGMLSAEARRVASDALDEVERFAGTLRRERSALKQEIESQRTSIAALRGRVARGESEIARLDRAWRDQRTEAERLLRHISEPGIRLPSGENSDAAFTLIKAKCLACSLHFILCTDSPGRHSNGTMYCPECGQHEGKFLTWSEEVRGLIFELVPGSSELTGTAPYQLQQGERSMIRTIPGDVADLIAAQVLPEITGHYEGNPDPDRVYVIDAPGGLLGGEIVRRGNLEVEDDCPSVWGWYHREWVRSFLAHDTDRSTRDWIASADIKVLLMVDELTPRMIRLSRQRE